MAPEVVSRAAKIRVLCLGGLRRGYDWYCQGRDSIRKYIPHLSNQFFIGQAWILHV